MTKTKFDQLCEAFQRNRQQYSDYHRACVKCASLLVATMHEYLGIPEEALVVRPVREDAQPDPSMKYAIPAAIHLDEDTFWHLGVTLSVYKAPTVHPQERILLKILLKGDGERFERFILKLTREGEAFSVDPADKSSFHPFLDHVHQRLMNFYSDHLERFLAGKPESGFSG